MSAHLQRAVACTLGYAAFLSVVLNWDKLTVSNWSGTTLTIFCATLAGGLIAAIFVTLFRCYRAGRMAYKTGKRSVESLDSDLASAKPEHHEARRKEAVKCFAATVAASLAVEREKFILVQRGNAWLLRLRTPHDGGVYSELCRNVEDREVVEVAWRFAEEHVETMLVIDSELGMVQLAPETCKAH